MVENTSQSERETTEALMQEKRLFRPLPDLVVDANIDPNQYKQAVKKGMQDLEGFWEEAAQELDWFRKWDKVLDRAQEPFFKWFVNGKTNIAYNALDRHVKTHRKNKVAVIFESEEGVRARMTYYDLYRYTNMLANALTALENFGDVVDYVELFRAKGDVGSLGTSIVLQFLSNPFRAGS